MPTDAGQLVAFGVVAAAAVAGAIWWLALVAPWWLRARRAGLNLSASHVLGLRLRKVPPGPVIRAAAAAKRAGLPADIATLETYSLAGADPEAIVTALAMARQRGEEVELEDVFGLDVAGMDVVALARAGEPMAGLLGSKRSAQLGGCPIRS
jgi:uncharacterized protein YqfA (UPF0365 family)